MILGVPKEVKNHENRVALTPDGVHQLQMKGHSVIIQSDAGLGSGFPDHLYSKAGARLVSKADEIWKEADLILKVKEPVKSEFPLMREDQVIFTFFHFAADRELTEAVIESGSIAITYETVEKKDGTLPLLIPMSEVAGRMAAQEGAKFLEKSQGGRGILLGGIPGVSPANVLVLGAGIVGVNAAKITAGMGARTTIMDINVSKLRYLDDVMPRSVSTMFSSEANIRKLLPQTDLVIGSVLKPGARAPHLITREMLKEMKPGSVLIDVAIDQGGCFETSKPTTHEFPTFVVDEVVHYCVSNMPGAVPYTSTVGLTNVTLPYAIDLADHGWKSAVRRDPELRRGVNIAESNITYRDVAEAFEMEYVELEKLI